MKNFVLSIVSIIASACVILTGISLVTIGDFRNADYTLPKDVHTIVIGPSTTGCAFNDSLVPGLQNLSRDGTAVEWLLAFLPKILDENRQIDTVLISHGRFEFHPYTENAGQTDIPLQRCRHLLPIAMSDSDNFRSANHWLGNVNFYCAMLNPNIFLINKNHFTDYSFGYINIGRNNLHNVNADWGIAWYDDVRERNGDTNYTEEWIENACASFKNDRIRQAIEECKKRGVTPVLIFTPLFMYDRWFDKDGFKVFMKKAAYEDVLIADYEDFQFPDDSYYGDVHHLNARGAEYFSRHIAKNGLKVTTLKEWLAN